MSGYCIELYKFMRVDENFKKKDKLIESRNKIFSDNDSDLRYFFTYGEFDRISFEYVEKFSKYRDVPKSARGWIGDRQSHLVYAIPNDEKGNEDDKFNKEDIFYRKGNFYEWKGNEAVQSNRLFLGLTILQFKYSQKNREPDMKRLLSSCKTKIMKLVKEAENVDVKCSVYGTLGSYGLTIIWLADQYEDILKLVTKIKNMSADMDDEKSIFLSAYTIFAQNNIEESFEWKERMKAVRGNALLHITLKKGLESTVENKLFAWRKEESSVYHCAGEHDVFIRMESANVYKIFKKDLNSKNSDFYNNYILQTNVELCEVIRGRKKDEHHCKDDDSEGKVLTSVSGKNEDTEADQNNMLKGESADKTSGGQECENEKGPLPQLDEIQNKYNGLRDKFAIYFPKTAGMVDTLDKLYSDYISKISTASNEMWIDGFSHQFLRILSCISEIIIHLNELQMKKEDVLDIIREMLCDFERQISHIAESNNLMLGTPVCQFRYSGQNNLTLYAYFGIIKKVLQFIYKAQKFSSQIEIVPLIVTDIVPIIQSKLLFFDNKIDDKTKIITINLPMTALYNPVCYYPYLYHEIFHYVVPLNRHIRNQVIGAVISIRILHSSLKRILYKELLSDSRDEILEKFIDLHLVNYIYYYVLQNYKDYIGRDIENLDGTELSCQKAGEKILSGNEYEKKVIMKWLCWINAKKNVSITDNFFFGFLKHLYNQNESLKNNFEAWANACENENTQKSVRELQDKINKFIDRLSGIVDNGIIESADENFDKLTNVLNDEILTEASTLGDAIKEGIADTSMVAMADLDFAEYLLLFTKTKKELLMGYGCDTIEVQEIIRIGMVLEYLCKDGQSDDDYIGVVDIGKEAFISMYCGLYYGNSKLDDAKYKERLSNEAEMWFYRGRECCVRYNKRYRIYAALLKKLQEIMIVSEKKELEDFKKDSSKYWKNYADSIKIYGNYIRNNDLKENISKWEEMRSFTEKKIFDENIDLICAFQSQIDFHKLDDMRVSRIGEFDNCVFENTFSFDSLTLNLNIDKQKAVIKDALIQWKYEVKSVEELCKLTADIAKHLERSNRKALREDEYPIWYRGQQSAKYKLLPSIMRKYKDEKKKCKDTEKFSLVSFLRQEYEEFKFRADGAPEAIEQTGYTDSDYIALMQHYSVASNFLDWTEDALSALYFALEGFLDKKAEKTNEDAALYIFSPALYNHIRNNILNEKPTKGKRCLETEKAVINTAKQEGIPNLTVPYNVEKYNMYQLGNEDHIYDNSQRMKDDMIEDTWEFYLPLAIYVSRLNKRLQAQSGIFLAYNIYTAPNSSDNFDYISLEDIQEKYLENFKHLPNLCPFLYKIIINKDVRESIAEWVKAFGMSKEKCYPELANIGERIMK